MSAWISLSGMHRLIQVDILRRVHNVGFLAEWLICITRPFVFPPVAYISVPYYSYGVCCTAVELILLYTVFGSFTETFENPSNPDTSVSYYSYGACCTEVELINFYIW